MVTGVAATTMRRLAIAEQRRRDRCRVHVVGGAHSLIAKIDMNVGYDSVAARR
jgi:hypothetical protein